MPAIAQDTGASPSVEKVTVTGSRIKKRDYSTTSPVTTIGAQTFELTQTNSVERLLNDLPQLVPGNTFTSNNAGGEDFATLDLRGLGPNRTLILVNGRRLPAGSTSGAVDINTVPAGLIDRVEVVTGGASAVYGSDAISGVVNFILKKDYEGMEITGSASQAENGYAEERNVQALIGGNFANGNGNITMYAEYFSREGLLQSKQGFSRTAGSYCYSYSYSTGATTIGDLIHNADEARACYQGGGSVAPGGSGTPPWSWIVNNSSNPFRNLNTIASTAPRFTNADKDCDTSTPGVTITTGNLSFNDAGQLTPRFAGGGRPCNYPDRTAGSSRYNYAPDNYIVLPAERYNVSVFGHYDFEKDLHINFGAIYSDSFTRVQLAPTPATDIPVEYTDALQAFLLSNHRDLYDALASRTNRFADFVINRRTTELGTRNGLNEDSQLSLFASLEGEIDDHWSWELAASFADVDFVSKLENSANKLGLIQGIAGCKKRTPGLNGILGDADDVDVSLGISALPGCVQVDPFGAGNITGSQIDFLRVNTWTRNSSELSVITGSVNGDLFDPFGAGDIAMVVGGEYRANKSSVEVDNEQRSGNIYGFNALQDQFGSQDVYEAFGELSVPLVKDQPYIYYLGLEAGYRISDYSTVADPIETYKYGGEYSPFQWLKFRGIYNKATRAPSVVEGFQAGDQGFPSYPTSGPFVGDPCKDGNGDGQPDWASNGVTLAECLTVGGGFPNGYAGFVQNNTQFQAFAFGNPDLSPEEAETTTMGVVLQTGNDWFGIGNLRGSVDRYDIQITNVITATSGVFIMTDCYIANNPDSCAKIVRDPLTGQIDHVDTGVANAGTLSTVGTDVQLDYRLNLQDVGLDGVFSVNELMSFIDDYSQNGLDFSGTTAAGVGGAVFDWKSVLSGTYTLDDWTLFSRWSYVPELLEIVNPDGSEIFAPEASYVDLALRYSPVEWMNVTVTVNNVEDKGAPVTFSGLADQANTDPQVYDVLGRTWALSIKTKM